MSDLSRLALLVQSMRQWQQTYFRTRRQADLSQAKRHEKLVDQAVEDTLAGRDLFSSQQGRMPS